MEVVVNCKGCLNVNVCRDHCSGPGVEPCRDC